MNRHDLVLLLTLAAAQTPTSARAQFVTRLEHDVVASRLVVSPETLYVPKNIPGSLRVELSASVGEVGRLGVGTHVEGVLRGPAFPAHRLLGLPNEPLILPPLALVGEYRIDDLRLVDTTSGETLLMGEPSSVVVHVFPEVLVAQVESRPLSMSEIESRGLVIDETRFSAHEFEVAFSVDGQSLAVRFPVVRPAFLFATEIIPLAEIASRRVEAERINRELIAALSLPPQLRVPGLDVQIQPLGMVDVGREDGTPPTSIPMPAIMVIPGNVGFLNQFFSVQIYVANAAPPESGLSVHSLEAELLLPSGRDLLPGSPDDPLVLAASTAAGVQMGRLAIRDLGVDGLAGTADDSARFEPGQTGRAEFLVEGRREGLHTLDVRLFGRVDGLAAGEVPIEGHTIGSVLVRNPNFSLAFTHPEVVRAGEPYSAAITVLNTGEVEANLVSVNLRAASVVGAELAPDQPDSVPLGTIPAGESRTAEFRFIARRTGKVGFGNITGDDGLTGGRFDLTMGIGERGVALNADALVYPEWVDALPEGLRRATDRVLGQALSVATAGILPPGVRRIERTTVDARVLELAEAGQRLRYGDAPQRVYLDLWLDWIGGRSASLGFDQLLRETQAGLELRQAISELLTGQPASALLATRAPDLAARGEGWFAGATSSPGIGVEIRGRERVTGALTQVLAESSVLPVGDGSVGVVRRPDDVGDLEITFVVPAGASASSAEVLGVVVAGQATRRSFSLPASGPTAVCYRVLLGSDPGQAVVDTGCDRTTDGLLGSSLGAVNEVGPAVVAAHQELGVRTGRPRGFCEGPTFEWLGRARPYHNYGTLIAVLFNKPMSSDSLTAPGVFSLDNGVAATGVSIQRGGRVALVNLGGGVASFRPRQLALSGASDQRGAVLSAQVGIERRASAGVSIAGRVIGSDGNPAPNLPVTLTMTDFVPAPLSAADDLADWLGGLANANETSGGAACEFPVQRRITQVRSDSEGRFELDYVMAGLPYRLSATDVRGLNELEVEFVLETSRGGEAVASEAQRQVRDFEAEAAQSASLFFSGTNSGGRVAIAEGLDRAIFDDQISIGSPRYASEVPVALRFRGRGVVAGRVLASNGVSPLADVAVNLIPEASSREKARGVFTGSDGSFRFEGVPLGAFTVQAANTAGLRRAVAGRLVEIGEVLNIEVVLAETASPLGRVTGRVFEADGATPIAGAQVQVGYANDLYLPAVNSDGNGDYVVERVPFTGVGELRLTAVAGGAFVQRNGLTVIPDVTVHADLVMPGRSEVEGRVERPDGTPVGGALVAGGVALVTTDSNGLFLLSDVPVGLRELAAGVPGPSPRFGRTRVNVLPNARVAATIVLDPVGQIAGTVRNAQGAAIPNVRVAIPLGTSFRWVNADAQGQYLFPMLPVGSYTLSAPAPVPRAAGGGPGAGGGLGDAVGLIEAALLSSDPSRQSAEAEALPLPGAFGFTRARIDLDGQVVTADITYLPLGSLSGTVLNHQGRPLGADVSLSTLALNSVGQPRLRSVSTRRSDVATGAFSFSSISPGPFALSAQTPLYPAAAEASGSIPPGGATTGVTLQFGESAMGRLAGVVTRDGSPVGAGATVRISLSPGYQLLTDAAGRFDTQIDVPMGVYRIEALDPVSGREGSTMAVINRGGVTEVEVPLLRADGGLTIEVRETDGTAAPSVDVAVERAGFPPRSYALTTNGSGQAQLTSLIEGSHSVAACAQRGQLRLCTRGVVQVQGGADAQLSLTLAQRGTIRGRYVESDGVTTVGFVQVELTHSALGRIGFASGDAQGAFQLEGIPPGNVTVTGRNPVTGRSARQTAAITYAGEIRDVLLREDSLGQVVGRVIGADGVSSVPAAPVTLSVASPLFEPVRLVAGPSGEFSFPSVPPGPFLLSASSPVDGLSGSRSSVMPSPATVLTEDVALDPHAFVPVHVVEANGTPVGNAEVRVGSVLALTNPSGDATVGPVPLGAVRLTVRSTAVGRTRSAAVRTLTLNAPGQVPGLTIQLPGVGRVQGIVRRADNSLVVGGTVTVRSTDPIHGHVALTALTGADGRFDLADVALGSAAVEARLGALAGSATGNLVSDGQILEVPVTLSASSEVHGRLVRADGLTPIPGVTVNVSYSPPSGFAGSATTITAADGTFSFGVVPAGPFSLAGSMPNLDAVLAYAGTVPVNSTSVDLGDILVDEARPEVVEVLPFDGETGVSVTAPVEVIFSEAMAPGFDDPAAAYITEGLLRVPLQLSWGGSPAAGYDRLILTPNAPLEEETEYSVVILGASGTGGLVTAGPTDLAGRALASAFVTRFRTRDATPPTIDSFTPLDGQAQVDPNAVVRIAFNEVVNGQGLSLGLSGAGGPVPGTATLGLDGRVAVFTPSAPLSPNAEYQATLTAAADLAGNAVSGLPVTHTFRTLDTAGPVVIDLNVQDNLPMLQGTTVTFVATLASSESGAQLHLSRDLRTIWTSPIDQLSIPVYLDQLGGHTFWARAVDGYGNYGPWYQETYTVVPNLPPTISLVQILPTSGPLVTGQPYALRAEAADDAPISRVMARVAGALNQVHTETQGSAVLLSGTVPASLVPGVATVMTGEVEDSAGVIVTAAPLPLTIVDGVAPVVSLSSPGVGAPGQTVAVAATAMDAVGVVELVLETTGALVSTQGGAVSPPDTNHNQSFNVTVPVTAVGGSTIQLLVRATDSAGNEATAAASIHVDDVIAPTLATVSPANGAVGVSRSSFVDLTFSEPVTGISGSSVVLRTGGVPVAATVNQPNGAQTARLTPSTGLLASTNYEVSLTSAIQDLTGLPLVPVTTTFSTESASVPGPAILSVSPIDAATNTVLRPTIRYNFDAPILASSVQAATFTLSDEDGAPVPVGGAVVPPNQLSVEWRPTGLLRPGVVYVARLAGTITDAAGHAIVDPLGSPFSEYGTTFTTASIELVFPGGDRIVERVGDRVNIVAEAAAGLTGAYWVVDGVDVGHSQGASPSFSVGAPAISDRPSGTAVYSARALVPGGFVDVPERVLTLEPYGGDFDADGLTNGAEVTAGLDPWADDANLDPDGDTLSNAQELNRGTSPFSADTDGTDPLSGNRPPAVGVARSSRGVELRTNPTADLSFPDGVRVGPPFTWEVWVRAALSAPYTSSTPIFHSSDGAWAFVLDEVAQRIGVTVQDATGGPQTFWGPALAASGSSLGEHHLAFNHDGARVQVLLDGRLIGTAPMDALSYQPSGVVRTGDAHTSGIDEVRLWNVALTPSTIALRMRRPPQAGDAGLLGYWSLDDAPNTALDASGNGLHAVPRANVVTRSFNQPLLVAVSGIFEGSSEQFQIQAMDPDANPALTWGIGILPTNGSLYRSSETSLANPIQVAPVSFGAGTQPISYVVDPGFVGIDSFEVIATDGVQPALPAVFQPEVPPSKVWIGGASGQPNAWNVATNWSPSGVPVATDRVEIPAGTGPAIALSAPVSISGLTVGAGRVVDIGTQTLTITGHITANEGEVTGTGLVVLGGRGAVVHGRFPNVSVQGSLRLTSDLIVNGDLSIPSVDNPSLAVGSYQVLVHGDLDLRGRLVMDDPASRVEVDGDVLDTASLANSSGHLSAGTMILRGNYQTGGSGHGRSSGTHEVILAGVTSQVLTPGSRTAHFQNLTISNPAGVVLNGALIVSGQLRITAGAFMAGGTSVSAATLELGVGTALSATTVSVSGSTDLAQDAVLSATSATFNGPLTSAATAQVTTTSLRSNSIPPAGASFTDLIITGFTDANRDLTVPGRLEITASGSLSPGTWTVVVGGELRVNGALRMSDGRVEVGGRATFGWHTTAGTGGACDPSPLSGGRLVLHGGLDVRTNGCLVGSGTHRVELAGGGAQLLHVAGSGATTSRLAHLELAGGSVNVTSPLYILGSMTLGTSLQTSANLTVLGTTSLNAGATLTGASSTFAGTFQAVAGTNLTGTTVTIGNLSFGNGNLTATTLNLGSASTIPAGFTFTNLEIQGQVVAGRNLTIPGHLTVAWTASLPGDFDVGANTVAVGGNFTWHGRLRMTSAAAILDVAGNIAATASNSCLPDASRRPSTLTAGELRAGGNVSLICTTPPLIAQPGHRFVLDGTTPQSVNLNANSTGALNALTGGHFGDLIIRNSAGVTATSNLRISGNLNAESGSSLVGQNLTLDGAINTAAGAEVSAAQVSMNATPTETAGQVTASSLILDGASTSLPPWTIGTLAVRTPVVLSGARAITGTLNVEGSAGGGLTLAGQTLTVGGDALILGPLVMNNSLDLLTIAGNLALTNGGECASGLVLTGGVLSVGGNLSAFNCGVAPFVAGTGHTTVMTGSSRTITWGNVSQNGFGTLEIALGASVSLGNNVRILGTGRVAGTLNLPVAGPPRTLTVSGTLNLLPTGTINNSGTITVLGACVFDPAGTRTGNAINCP